MNTIAYILLMILVTNAIRILPVTLIRKRITNPFLCSFLYYVPYVTLSVMTFPAMSLPLPVLLPVLWRLYPA